MKTLREEYKEFEEKVSKRYKELESKRDYDFSIKAVAEEKEEWRETVKNLIEEEDFIELQDYDVIDMLPTIYYNNRHGEEKEGYILTLKKEGGLYIINSDKTDAFYIKEHDLNGVFNKIVVIEAIEELD